jgi:hypothetical protein
VVAWSCTAQTESAASIAVRDVYDLVGSYEDLCELCRRVGIWQSSMVVVWRIEVSRNPRVAPSDSFLFRSPTGRSLDRFPSCSIRARFKELMRSTAKRRFINPAQRSNDDGNRYHERKLPESKSFRRARVKKKKVIESHNVTEIYRRGERRLGIVAWEFEIRNVLTDTLGLAVLGIGGADVNVGGRDILTCSKAVKIEDGRVFLS